MLFACSAFAQANVPADVFVKSVADDVLAIVKKDKDIQNGDQAKIFALAEEKIVPNFNFDHVCKLVLGKNFSKATKDQQDAFEREFKKWIVTRAEKMAVMEAMKAAKVNDYAKIRFAEEYTGYKFQ